MDKKEKIQEINKTLKRFLITKNFEESSDNFRVMIMQDDVIIIKIRSYVYSNEEYNNLVIKTSIKYKDENKCQGSSNEFFKHIDLDQKDIEDYCVEKLNMMLEFANDIADSMSE